MGLGNHEFDKGPEVLANFVNQADFPVLCANFDFSKEKTLAGKISPWTIVQKGGEKYGLFGLTGENTNEISSPGSNIVIKDSIQAAQQTVAALKQQGINKIIALTQISWEKDLELAQQVQDIDVIIGGHSHTIPEIYPTVINQSSTPTLIVQAGAQGRYLGQLNISFDGDGIIKNWDKSQLITMDEKIEPDPVCVNKLAEYQKPINDMLNTITGQTLVDLDGDRKHLRVKETNLGNMVTDAMLSKARHLGASIAILNGGAIRNSIPSGNISLGQILEVLPYGNYLTIIRLNGQQIMASLENGVSQAEQEAGRFPQVAGIRYTWNPNSPAGSRITAVEVKTGNLYQPIDLSASYSIATTDFLAGGGDGYTIFQEAGDIYHTGLTDYEFLQEYLKANSPVNPGVEGRIREAGEK